MSVARIKELPYPEKKFESHEDAWEYCKELRNRLQEDQSERIEDFDQLKIDNVGWKDVRAYAKNTLRKDGLAHAISKIGSTETTLLISNQQDVTADATVPSTMTLRFMQGGSLNISSAKTVTINGQVISDGGYPFTGAGSVAFTPSADNAVLFNAQQNIADKYAKILGSVGETPTTQGVQFVGLNDDGELKVFGAIVGEVESDDTPDLEKGRLHFLTLDSDGAINFLQVIGTIDHFGSWILGPGIASFAAEVAGAMTINSVAGDGTMFSERVSVVAADHASARALAIRNIKYTDLNDLDYEAGIVFTVLNSATKERPVGYLRGKYVNRTAGSERTQMYHTFLHDDAEVHGAIFEIDQFTKGSYTGVVPGFYGIKPHVIENTSSFAFTTTAHYRYSGAVLTNSGAKSKITITLPDLDSIGVGWHFKFQNGVTPVSKISGYKWTASGADAGAYYLVTTADGDPGFADPIALYAGDGNKQTKAGVGALANGEWTYGDADTLGFSTIYIQVAAGDPDGLSYPFFVTYETRIVSFSTSWDMMYYTGGASNTYTLDSDGEMGTVLDFYSIHYQTYLRGWQGSIVGTWTKI